MNIPHTAITLTAKTDMIDFLTGRYTEGDLIERYAARREEFGAEYADAIILAFVREARRVTRVSKVDFDELTEWTNQLG